MRTQQIYHCLMPFSRPENVNHYVRMFADFNEHAYGKYRCLWRPILPTMKDWPSLTPVPDFIQPVECGPVPGLKITEPDRNMGSYRPGTVDPCYWKLNYFLDNVIPSDEDYYHFLCDDDTLPYDYFDKLVRHTGDVIMTCMHRGHATPKGDRKHPHSIVLADPQNLTVSHCGHHQLIVKGKVLKRYRFRTDFSGADGEFVIKVCQENKVDWADEVFCYFNWFEPGRWDLHKLATR